MDEIIKSHASDKEAVMAAAWVLNKLKKKETPEDKVLGGFVENG